MKTYKYVGPNLVLTVAAARPLCADFFINSPTQKKNVTDRQTDRRIKGALGLLVLKN